MLLKYIYLLIIFILVGSTSYAQIDNEFWFVAPEVTSLHADRPIFLRFKNYHQSSDIEISLPANPNVSKITFTLPAQGFQSINITSLIDKIENSPNNTVLNKGIYIKSTNYISVYYEVYGSNSYMPGVNCDIFVLKGRHALGKEFVTPFQQTFENYANINAFASFDIVATEDNTTIEITPQVAIDGHGPFKKITIILNKGQTWSGRSINHHIYNKPLGTYIKSNKPIAVTVKDDSMLKEVNYDLGGDQIIPISKLGTQYIVMNPIDLVGQTTNIVSIMAIQHNTFVKIENTTYLLNKYENIDLPINKSTYINSSLPIYVLQTAGFKNELGQSILPPIECIGSKEIGFVRSNQEKFVLNILAQKGSLSHFKLSNQIPIDSVLFTEVPFANGEWYQYSQSFNTNELKVNTPYYITNSQSFFQLSIMNGNSDSTGFRMGYFSDYGFVDLGSDKTICKGDIIKLDAGPFMDSYQWFPNGETSPSIYVSDSGRYIVSVIKQECIFSDTINIYFPPTFENFIITKKDTICYHQTLPLKTTVPFNTYQWSNGSIDSTTVYSFKQTGNQKINLIVKDSFQCSYKDSFDIYVRTPPTGFITYNSPNIESLCAQTQKTLYAPSGYNYLWYTGETSSSINYIPTAEPLVSVILTDINQCSNTIDALIDCSTFINIPNMISRNNDSKNDSFMIEGLIPNTYTLELYSIYGKLIYKEVNYTNNWAPDNSISAGVYYVHLIHYNNKYNYKGWLHIVD